MTTTTTTFPTYETDLVPFPAAAPPSAAQPNPVDIFIPTAPAKPKNMTDDEFRQWRQDMKDAAAKRVFLGLEALCNEETFRAWVRSRGRFHRYSWLNSILILLQFPGHQEVASYDTWKSLKRQVRRGSKGISIWYPIMKEVQKRDDNGNPLFNKDGTPITMGVVHDFRVGKVFDISQTDGEPLPPMTMPVDHHGDDRLSRLASTLIQQKLAAAGCGYETRELRYAGDISRQPKGFFQCDPPKIVLHQGLGSVDHLATLCHEAAHFLATNRNAFGSTEESYSHGELVAEGSSAIVLETLGYDSTPFSVPYLGFWLYAGATHVTDGSIDMAKMAMREITTIADAILDWLTPLLREEERGS